MNKKIYLALRGTQRVGHLTCEGLKTLRVQDLKLQQLSLLFNNQGELNQLS